MFIFKSHRDATVIIRLLQTRLWWTYGDFELAKGNREGSPLVFSLGYVEELTTVAFAYPVVKCLVNFSFLCQLCKIEYLNDSNSCVCAIIGNEVNRNKYS